MSSPLAAPVNVSTTFHPNARLAAANNAAADLTLLSVDGVIFYVHNWVLMRASSNAFGGLLANPTYAGVALAAEDDVETLDFVLRAAYGLDHSSVQSWEPLTRMVSTLRMRYGLPLPAPGSQLFSALSAHVFRPGGAQEVYAFAGGHEYEALAVAASEHLLSLSLTDLPAEWQIAVGAVYLRRLYFLHLGRTDVLMRILPVPPVLHAPEPACGTQDMQEHTLQPWARAVSDLIFEARADTPPAKLSAKLNPISYHTPCAKCAAAVRQRIETIVQEWSAVKGPS
ncbi:hypothetical protein AURDEDRAFT_139693 [Auricularia subglabra TFB-10046 SS5]|uniref:BTB domain-containing protein n=1 Tax=Auricularia subglabra (strain TFB-10046 / SS5) TaxID=717982 RepID=J0DB97_AURST|nr:hypothetical protein AURDEDRAFT_139693 [Auricularia subglabra TFB-10046 SS5]